MMLNEEVAGEAVLSVGVASTAGVVPTGADNLRHHWLEEYEHRIFHCHDSPSWPRPRPFQQPEAEKKGDTNGVEISTGVELPMEKATSEGLGFRYKRCGTTLVLLPFIQIQQSRVRPVEGSRPHSESEK
jgi:hypothetical protein